MRARRLGLALLCAVSPLCGQLQLTRANGGAVGAVYDFGGIETGEAFSAGFRLNNLGAGPAVVSLLAVSGAGFSLAGAPLLPQSIAPGSVLEFSVSFRGADPGSYSAVLRSEGISVLLTAKALPHLTYSIVSGNGRQELAAGTPVDLGTAEVGASVTRNFEVENRSAVDLIVPAISVAPGEFVLAGASPSGTVLHPGESAVFNVRFQPASAGERTAALAVAGRSYTLTGSGKQAPMPKPLVSIDLKQARSAQQGEISVRLPAPAPRGASGSVTLDFQPALAGVSDPAVVLAPGGRTAPFTVADGEMQARFGDRQTLPFQTGTTAGSLIFNVQLGDYTDQQTVTVAPSPVGIQESVGARVASGLEIRITGFDNTRSAGLLSFSFFDRSGNVIGPGAVTADGKMDFARYFQSSPLGGVFLLRAVFPVTGDAAAVDGFEAVLTNSAGSTKTSRRRFP